MKNTFNLKCYILVLATIFLNQTQAGPRGGGGADIGGGDLVRADFLKRGEAVIEFLKESPQGQAIVKEQNLSVDKLKGSLDVNIIKVIDDVLIDRTGSVVDALGKPGEIQLNKKQWAEYTANDLDNYFLVFHEMLRENGINDDNYIISKKISPFSKDYQIGNLFKLKKPLLLEDNLSDVIQKENIVFAGNGCESRSLKTWARFDESNNQFEIYPYEMKSAVGGNQKQLERKNCSMRIPFKAKAGLKMVITQIDMAGEVDLTKNKKVSLHFLADEVGGSAKIKTKVIQATQALSAGFLFRENRNFETKCGSSGMIALNTSAIIQDQALNSEAKVSSVQVNKISLSIKAVSCSN